MQRPASDAASAAATWQQRKVFTGTQLKDGFIGTQRGGMQTSMKTLTGKTDTLDIKASDTIDHDKDSYNTEVSRLRKKAWDLIGAAALDGRLEESLLKTQASRRAEPACSLACDRAEPACSLASDRAEPACSLACDHIDSSPSSSRDKFSVKTVDELGGYNIQKEEPTLHLCRALPQPPPRDEANAPRARVRALKRLEPHRLTGDHAPWHVVHSQPT